jgi:hypothetical protein
MPEETKNTPKQFFDIKTSPNPQPTTRPVVTQNDQVKSDPMVSPVSQPITSPVVGTQTKQVVEANEVIHPAPVEPADPASPAGGNNVLNPDPAPELVSTSQPVSQHTVSIHAKSTKIKRILGVVVVLALVIIAFLVHKYKIGK